MWLDGETLPMKRPTVERTGTIPRTGSSTAFVRAGAAMLVAATLLAACSVKSTGVTGVGLDESGGLGGYIQMCSDRIDGTTFYESDGDTLGRWDAPGPVTDFATWSFDEPGDWTATQTYAQPSRGKEYSLFGGTSDDSTSSQHVTFRLNDLDGMSPGEVLYGDRSVGFKRVSEVEFRRHACDDQ